MSAGRAVGSAETSEGAQLKRHAALIAGAWAIPAFAQSTAKDIYISAVIGGASIAGLILMVAAYRLTKSGIRKVKQVVVERSQPTSPTPNKAVQQSSPVAPSMVEQPSEACWSAALAEFDREDRRPGLWAKVFSAAAGNEGLAKSEYLRIRAQEFHLEMEAERQGRREEDERLHAANSYQQLATGRFSPNQTIEICETQLRALGFAVERPRADKWEVRRNTSTSFAYSLDELRRLTDAFTADDLRRRAAGPVGDAA